MSMAANNLVHESETQRQYVRVSLPARADVNGQQYIVTDLSSGGVSLQNVEEKFTKGDESSISLTLPFKSFSMDIELDGEVRHANDKHKTVGFRFINLTAEQTSLLNHVLRSFIAGEIVAGSDLLAVVSRENFVKVRHHSDVESDKSTFWKRQAIPFALIAILGLTAFFIIAKNVYNGLFVLESSQAYVSGNKIALRAPINGIYNVSLKDDVKSVQKGQTIANIGSFVTAAQNANALTAPVNQNITLQSPCDCYILSEDASTGQYVSAGTDVITLVNMAETPWVTAVISTRDAQRVSLGDTANIFVAGSDVELKGVVEGFSVNETGGTVIGASEGFDTGVKVKIKAQQKLPVDLVGRPARVDFNL